MTAMFDYTDYDYETCSKIVVKSAGGSTSDGFRIFDLRTGETIAEVDHLFVTTAPLSLNDRGTMTFRCDRPKRLAFRGDYHHEADGSHYAEVAHLSFGEL